MNHALLPSRASRSPLAGQPHRVRRLRLSRTGWWRPVEEPHGVLALRLLAYCHGAGHATFLWFRPESRTEQVHLFDLVPSYHAEGMLLAAVPAVLMQSKPVCDT
jgi:hypothetical protein